MILMLAAIALSTAPTVASVPGPDIVIEEQTQASYEDLATGRTAEAIAALESRLQYQPNDPALLINLGYGYAKQGNAQRAVQAYRAAIASDTEYRLELADGSWMGSRDAARLALRTIERSAQFAALEN